MVQYSHPYMTTGKITALAICTFVGKVMSLLFNMLLVLSGLFFSPKEQTSFNFMAAFTICSDFGAHQNKVFHCFHCFPIYLPIKKILGPTADFPTWGSGKGTENLRGICLWRPVGFDYRTYTGMGKQSWRAQTLCAPGPRRKEQ